MIDLYTLRPAPAVLFDVPEFTQGFVERFRSVRAFDASYDVLRSFALLGNVVPDHLSAKARKMLSASAFGRACLASSQSDPVLLRRLAHERSASPKAALASNLATPADVAPLAVDAALRSYAWMPIAPKHVFVAMRDRVSPMTWFIPETGDVSGVPDSVFAQLTSGDWSHVTEVPWPLLREVIDLIPDEVLMALFGGPTALPTMFTSYDRRSMAEVASRVFRMSGLNSDLPGLVLVLLANTTERHEGFGGWLRASASQVADLMRSDRQGYSQYGWAFPMWVEAPDARLALWEGLGAFTEENATPQDLEGFPSPEMDRDVLAPAAGGDERYAVADVAATVDLLELAVTDSWSPSWLAQMFADALSRLLTGPMAGRSGGFSSHAQFGSSDVHWVLLMRLADLVAANPDILEVAGRSSSKMNMFARAITAVPDDVHVKASTVHALLATSKLMPYGAADEMDPSGLASPPPVIAMLDRLLALLPAPLDLPATLDALTSAGLSSTEAWRMLAKVPTFAAAFGEWLTSTVPPSELEVCVSLLQGWQGTLPEAASMLSLLGS